MSGVVQPNHERGVHRYLLMPYMLRYFLQTRTGKRILMACRPPASYARPPGGSLPLLDWI